MLKRLASSAIVLMSLPAVALAQDKPLDGVTLNIASQNDPFAAVMARVSEQFEEQTGAEVNVEILSYPELLTKVTADFIGNTGGYDIVTMDIVWAGQFEEAGHTVELSEWIERDADELSLDDIYPIAMEALGQYNGNQIAYPFAGYANVLAYRKDLYEAAGLTPPSTMDELITNAKALTDADADQYGFVANGAKGPAVAQDWMQYNSQLGGSILDAEGMPALNSPENVESLRVYKELFDETAPPGAVSYDWGGREESFRQGLVANMQSWSVGASSYDNPEQSRVVGKAGISLAPVAEGMDPTYGFGGWGLAINDDISDAQKEAAWEFIKWITSPDVQIEMSLMGGGGVIRKSTSSNAEVVEKFPHMPIINESFLSGNGDYRPRIPQYPEIQDILGTAVNAVLVGDEDPQAALDAAQSQAERLF
ncbi:MAG: extracellular solute-binding protein [Pseudomonadota bacterium]